MRYVVEFEDGERFEMELDPGRTDAVIIDGERRHLQIEGDEGGAEVTTEDGRRSRLRLTYQDGHLIVCTPDGRRRRVRVELAEAAAWRKAVCAEPPREGATIPDELKSPIAGHVLRILVDSGATVAAGEALLIIEAMKMQNSILAPKSGRIVLTVESGKSVRAGDLLATITSSEAKS